MPKMFNEMTLSTLLFIYLFIIQFFFLFIYNSKWHLKRMSQGTLILQLPSNTILLLHEHVQVHLAAINHVTDLKQKLFSQAKYHTGKKRYM